MVKWIGLPYNESTWEIENDLENDIKIAQFYRRNSTVPQRKLRKLQPLLSQPSSSSSSISGNNNNKSDIVTVSFKGNRELRPYQSQGFQWMIHHYLMNQNCILADEMGLGKTVQSIATCQYLVTKYILLLYFIFSFIF